MQDHIALLLAVLGTLLVVAGAALTVVRTATSEADPEEVTLTRRRRLRLWIKSLQPADRLIGWGVVLLLLSAIASGAVVFDIGAKAGTGAS
jgi:hypothetical protein